MQFSRTAWEAHVGCNADAGLSKLNSMQGDVCYRPAESLLKQERSDAAGRAQPGSVDMLGPVCIDVAAA